MEQVVTVQETGALTGHRRQPEGASISWLKQGYTENRAAPPMDRNKLQRTEWSYKSGLSEGHDFVDTGATPYLLTAGFTYVLTSWKVLLSWINVVVLPHACRIQQMLQQMPLLIKQPRCRDQDAHFKGRDHTLHARPKPSVPKLCQHARGTCTKASSKV
eukprot:1157832-Pelagomonas_calceolata.AAC.1